MIILGIYLTAEFALSLPLIPMFLGILQNTSFMYGM